MPKPIRRNLIIAFVVFLILIVFAYQISMPDDPLVAVLLITFLAACMPIAYIDEYAGYYKKQSTDPELAYRWQKRANLLTLLLSSLFIGLFLAADHYLADPHLSFAGIYGSMTGLIIGTVIKLSSARSEYKTYCRQQKNAET